MNHRTQSYIPGAGAVVLGALALMLLPWLGETLFYSKGEPREAIVGLSILQSGEWILPLNYGADIPYKPPFLGWLIAIFGKLLNGGHVNEFIARLPSAVAAIAMVYGGFLWARRARGVRFAMVFSFVTACSFEVFRASLACRLDMVLTACMVGALYLLYHIRENAPRHRPLLYAVVWLLLSAATMTKGPVGALLPCFINGVYRLLRRDAFSPTLGKMLLLAILAMALPAWWFYAAWQEGGQHFFDLMYEENLGRLFGTMSYDSHVQPVWYNFVTLAAGLLPWTVLLLACCFGARRYRREPLSPAGLFAVTAAVLTVVFYSIPASKRSVYLLPAYPFICYGISSLIESGAFRKPVRFFAWFTAVLAVVAPVALTALQIWPLPKLPMNAIPWWGYIILALPMGAGIAWMVNRHSPVAHTCFAVWALFTAYAAVGMPAVLNPLSDKKFLAELTETADGHQIYTLKEYRLYSTNFYTGNTLKALPSVADAAACPPGTVVVAAPAATDTTGIGAAFDCRELVKRSADHRHTLIIGVRRPDSLCTFQPLPAEQPCE